MKKLLFVLVLALGMVGVSYANCSPPQVIYLPGGKIMTCYVCCDVYGNNCVTRCY